MDRYLALRIFTKVAELKSFSKAADQLGLAAAAPTLAVQELESIFRTKLLNRTTRSVELTEDGRQFLERSQSCLSDMEEMESMFQLDQAQINGKIRIDMMSTIARDVVIPRLPDFFEKYPDIEVEIVGSDRKLDLIREGIDCTIRSGSLETGLSAIDLDFGETAIVNVVSPSYIEKYGIPRKIEDLKNHRLVRYVQDFAQRPSGFEYFDGEKVIEVKMKSSVTVSNADAYKAAALAGLGICQNPLLGVRKFIKSGELIEILPKYRIRSGSCAKIVYPQSRYLAKRVRAFIEWVQPVLRNYFEA